MIYVTEYIKDLWMLGAGDVVPLITASDQTAFTAIFYRLVPVSLHRSITWMDTIVDYRLFVSVRIEIPTTCRSPPQVPFVSRRCFSYVEPS